MEGFSFESFAESNQESEADRLRKIIESGSEVLVKKEDLKDNDLLGFSECVGALGYFDKENVKWSVSGYDLVFINSQGDLCHAKIEPDNLEDFPNKNQAGESDSIKDLVVAAGFNLGQSDKFKEAVYRELNR